MRGGSLLGRTSREEEVRRKRSREYRRRGSNSPRDGSADCDGGDADDGGRFQSNVDDLEELRKRRHAREAKEMARERRIIFPQSAITNTVHRSNVREGKYQDQFNPTLSRN